MNITCDNCESIFEIKFNDKDTDGTPEYCPFCGNLLEEPVIPETDDFDMNDTRWDE